MAPAHAASVTMPRPFSGAPAEGWLGAGRDMGATTLHLISVATVFAFILILTVGALP